MEISNDPEMDVLRVLLNGRCEQQPSECLVAFPPRPTRGKKTAESFCHDRACRPAADRPFNRSS
jgi:hypothetical protein